MVRTVNKINKGCTLISVWLLQKTVILLQAFQLKHMKTYQLRALFFFPKTAYCFSILRDSNCWSNTSLEQALASVNTEQNETQFMPLQDTFFVVVRSDLCLVFKQRNIAEYNVRWFSSWKGQQGHTSPSVTRLSSSAWWLLRFLSSSTNSRHILNYWHKKVSSHNNISSRVLHFVNLVPFSALWKSAH